MSGSAVSPFKSDCLNGKVAFITGGGSGINLGVARSLGLHGCKLALMGRRKEVLENACKDLASCGIEAIPVQGDVRSYPSCQEAVKKTLEHYKQGSLDVLVNGAAGNFLARLEDLSPNGFKTVMEIDTLGTFHASKACFEALKASKNGVIINITATLHYNATKYTGHASAAKAAVDALTRGLAAEWGNHNIRVMGIAPGPIQGTEGMERLSGHSKDRAKEMISYIPLGRFGHVQDIGFASVYFCSSAASFITGTTLIVDGGAWLYTPPMVSEDMYRMLHESRQAPKAKL
eukprot:TRINITY_DN5014_c0_g2_i1.p1 TRINITY_DN5014_c0_g2~~TRINITY_DN5014_c0_g2_i1.p1  ORF type:complete len:308 (-),score=31.72 TRINITY_DN5014_c0_g2_i1:350-1216(-)